MKYVSTLNRIAAAVALSLSLSHGAFAQETASGVRGKVVGPNGQPVTDATITITHKPSGTRKTVKVNDTGSFTAAGLRVGGPYLITIDSDQFEDREFNDIFLRLGEVSRVNTQLESKTPIERIGVVGTRHALLNSGKSGPGSSFGENLIDGAPAFSRDLKDILRRDPLVNIGDGDNSELSIAGINPRFNSLSVDGVRQNDDFGLNGNGYPTQRSPISLLAVEQINVNTAPFSARSGGFSGGGIEAVTKSGTNEFSGQVFYEYSSDSLAGDGENEDGGDIELDFENKTYGLAVGGPIIEDKLFFFATYEKFESPFVTEDGPKDSNAPNIVEVLQSDIDAVRQIARDVYGVDVGETLPNPDEEDEKILLKLDWNINDDHRASFTYQFTEGNTTRPQGSFNNSRGDEIGLESHWYDNNQELKAYSAHLYSYWTDELSTELKVSLKEVKTGQDPLLGKGLGDVRVGVANNEDGNATAFVSFGPDQFRHGNELENDLLQIRFVAEYLAGDHAFSFGTEYEKLEVFNLFVPGSLGEFRFDSLDDFRNGVASRARFNNAFTGDPNDAAAEFEYETHTLFIEDKWDISTDFWVSFGLRYERLSTDDKPTLNENFFNRYNITNTENLDGEDIVLPRFGFNWLVQDNLTLRGGFGRFAGGRPNVWISNSFSNDGVTYVRGDNSGIDFNNVDITNASPDGLVFESGDGFVNAIDPNFELPSDWRYSLGVDYTADLGPLGDGYLFTTEYLIINKDKDVAWVDLFRDFPDDPNKQAILGPDGRRIYGLEENDRYDILLTNVDGGLSRTFSLALSKQFDNGISFGASYANQDVTTVIPGTSSTATSNFSRHPVGDRNNPRIGRSRYEIEHSFKFDLSYTTQFVDGYNSRISLYGERSSGRPYSFVYSEGVFTFGDQGQFDDSNEDFYLPYIPTGADDPAVRYADGFSYDQFATILQDNGLSGYAGQILPRNTEDGPWVSRLDLRLEQEIPGFMDGHKGVFYVDIKNFLNLIDSSSGKVRITDFQNVQDLVSIDYDSVANQYIYSPIENENNSNIGDEPFEFRSVESAWRLKLGVSYKF